MLQVFILSFFTGLYAQSISSTDTSGNLIFTSDSVCLKPEIEPAYPGGEAAFKRYLANHFIYTNKDVTGKVIVRFIVGKNFRTTNVEAISGPEQLKKDAIKMIQKSGRWTAGIYNGRMVTSYKTITIIFPNENSY